MNVPVSSPFNQGLRNGLISASRGIRSGGFESSVNIGGAIGFGFVGGVWVDVVVWEKLSFS